ncbi:hypothetical protein AAVH_32954 [Aphelenchoides avenae]|nr:hypothetical protein AAVH_32954 [Aphelenchus avenae]
MFYGLIERTQPVHCQAATPSTIVGLRAFIAFEVGGFAVSFASFCYLRRREAARRTLYEKFPLALDLYYKSEDVVSFGQQVGSRLRISDIRRWSGVSGSDNERLGQQVESD